MKSLRIYLITVAVLIVLYLIAQYNRPKAINWDETYSSSDKIPLGTYVVYHRLNDIFPGAQVQTLREPLYNVVNDHHIDHATYLIIANSVNLNEYDFKKLSAFIKNGSDVFISATYFGEELRKKLKIETGPEFNTGSGLKLINKQLDTSKTYPTDGHIGDMYFSRFDTAHMVALGKNSFNHVNFLRYSVGKGNLFLNANPRLFTNYSLLNSTGKAYAETALSFARNNSSLIWDQYYALGRDDEESNMRVFLRNPPLRWAFYISIFSLIAFVIYEAKRRQRIIPVIEPLENATLNFVNVVGQVYYEQRNNRNISDKKIVYFLEYLRSVYYLKTNTLDQEFIDNLAQKTAIEHSFATELVNHVNYLSSITEVSNSDLVKLNQLIEKFYKESR